MCLSSARTRHPDSSAAWLRTLRSTRLVVDTSDDKSHNSRPVSAVPFSTKPKQSVRSDLSRNPEHCVRLPRGVFHVENSQQTRWPDLVAGLQCRSRHPGSGKGSAQYCAALLRRGNSNKSVAPVARGRRIAVDGSLDTLRVGGTQLHPEKPRRLYEPLSS